MLYRSSHRAIAVVLAVAAAVWLVWPLQGAVSQSAPQVSQTSSAPDAWLVLGEGETASGTAKLSDTAANEAQAAGSSGDVTAAIVPAPPQEQLAVVAPASETPAAELKPATSTEAIPTEAKSEPTPQAAVPVESAKAAALPAFSFKDVRPLTAAPESVSENAPESAPAADPVAVTESPASAEGGQSSKPAMSFKDTRPLGALEPDSSKVPGVKDAQTTANTAGISFKDARPLVTPSFHDERLVSQPAFRDERPVTAPSFKDERMVTQPAFRDERPIASPSFSDTRPLAPDVDVSVKQAAPPAAESQETAAAAAPPALTLPPTTAVRPQSTAVAQGPLPTLIAVSPAAIRLDGNSGCKETEISTEALDGGQMRIRIAASCHQGEAVQVSYGGAEIIRKLDTWGALDFILDCFAGSASAAEVRMADGTAKSLPVIAKDLDKVSKIAVVWRASANLDLHVFEYGARDDEAGHIWAKSPSSIGSARVQAQADKRGHGLLGAIDDGQSLGDKVEVYTFVHNDDQVSGAISMALDYETRGEKPSGATCGSGALAEVDFQVSILPRNGQVSRQSGVLTRVECGSVIPREARFNQSALPVLRIKK